jgi:hypothetical protein
MVRSENKFEWAGQLDWDAISDLYFLFSKIFQTLYLFSFPKEIRGLNIVVSMKKKGEEKSRTTFPLQNLRPL